MITMVLDIFCLKNFEQWGKKLNFIICYCKIPHFSVLIHVLAVALDSAVLICEKIIMSFNIGLS